MKHLLLCLLTLPAFADPNPPASAQFQEERPATHMAQAMVPRPAAATPPSFPSPGYSPADAGASHGMLPAPARELAPRSPNKRPLPPTKEPGLWAADESPRAAVAPEAIAGVDVPFPDHPEALKLRPQYSTRTSEVRRVLQDPSVLMMVMAMT